MEFFAFGVGHAQDQHVFGQPAWATGGPFSSRFSHVRGDAQRETFFAQQGVAAVARAIRPNFTGLWIVHDVFGGVARPTHIFLASLQGRAHAVHARHELAIGAQYLVHGLAHAGHDFHIDSHVSAVGEFDADMGNRAAQGAHGKRHHIQGATSHAAIKQRLQGLAHLGRCHPVIGRAGVFFVFRANKGAVFNTRHIRGVGAGQKRVGAFDGVELFESAGVDQALAQQLVLSIAAVAPVNSGRLAQSHHLGDPSNQLGVFHKRWGCQPYSLRGGCVHGELLASIN